MLETPSEWLPVLAKRLDARQPTIGRLRSYADGNAPLPEMGPNTRATWLAFQKKARTNFGGIACQSHANRIRARGVRVGDDDQSAASLAARRIYRDNRLPMQIMDAVWDMLTARTGYLLAGVDEGRAVITAEKPEQFYAEPDPVRPWRTRAAIKVWRDSVAGFDYAMVWVAGSRQQFSRPSRSELSGFRTSNAGEWMQDGEPEPYEGAVPAWILDRRDGMGLIEPHLDVIDRINLGKLQRLSTAAIQAFKQRALRKGEDAYLPDKDESGNPIDWAKAFEPAPGALWDLPAGIDIWESPATDIRPMLEGEKADARDFAAVTGTPVAMLQPDAANQSATGAAATTAQQVDACREDIDRIRLAVAAAILTALRIEGVDFGDETVEVDFIDPQWVTLAEQMDAVSKVVAAGVSLPMAQKLYLGWTDDQIAEDERNRRREAARAFMGSSTAAGAPSVPAAPDTSQAAEMKAKFDALGVAIRAGVNPSDAAGRLGLDGIEFAGATPVALRLPESAANRMEDR